MVGCPALPPARPDWFKLDRKDAPPPKNGAEKPQAASRKCQQFLTHSPHSCGIGSAFYGGATNYIMHKILILTASFGDGHNAAARNLRDALELVTDDAKVEVLDLFESTYGSLNTLLKQTYQGLVRYAPIVWSGVFSVLDNPTLFRRQMDTMGKLRKSLAAVLHETEPDVVVSTYPVYAHLIQDIFREHAERPFRFITVVTDSISVCSAWYPRAQRLVRRRQRADGQGAPQRGHRSGAHQGARLPGQPGLRSGAARATLRAASRRPAQSALCHQHRQSQGRQGDRPPAQNSRSRPDHHRRPGRFAQSQTDRADSASLAAASTSMAGPIKCRACSCRTISSSARPAARWSRKPSRPAVP